ncbi:MAG: polysaccharide ABC transporter ATP-binding protein [Aulosira sp. ZfuVER01]|nr:polysaccharide ABC transporter ATP-binding protein [Aulosira sp. ZfuVER01]MDZ7997275.1 polysaccharide ABC transporter ATP-binding protein [Aulosira sp. DedVER01a]MDZ8055556.1 polysaccharide ABC transporter ATP-binding protein [Aulosira sp. ZfuCHP01]
MTISINEQEMALKPQNNENDIVLSVNGVSKKFCRDLKRSLMYGVQDIASELLGIRYKSDKLRKKEFWALDNVSFQLRRGEALGLIGKNGSGKSTLLRIIAGLIKPDTGYVEVNGRVAPLIALGAGFNPILTGRENIYANMSILGLSKKEIDQRFDEVIDFAEIGDAIDSPVQSYSSGMAARLGFASAIHTEPDILLIDEVLAVGDMKFRAKCYRRLAQLSKKGVTFVLVSHDTNTILSACNSAILLSMGKVVESGDTYATMQKYEESLFANELTVSPGKFSLPEKPQNESNGLDITYLCFKDENLNIVPNPVSGQPITLCTGIKAYKKFQDIGFSLLIDELSVEGERILRLSTYTDETSFTVITGEDEIRIKMPYFCLKPGLYTMKVSISQGTLNILDAIESFKFTVKNLDSMSECSFYQPRHWYLASQDIFKK